MKLNRTLLAFIIAVQSRKQFELDNIMLVHALEGTVDPKADWLKRVEEYFYQADKRIVEQTGLKLNNQTFEKMLVYEIPERAYEVEAHELGQFKF
jgi:cytochrome oxidase Cu insertion factor (SCO1/SenC/PrrC family)